MKPLLSIGVVVSCFFSALVNAHNKTVIVPFFDDAAKRPANVIVVAKTNGDFSDPVAAMASISGASETNPYLVAVAPGIYSVTQRIEMKPYVRLVGSGINQTKLVGSLSGAIIAGEERTTIENLTIENLGSGGLTIGIYNEGVNNLIENVRVFVTNGQGANVGVFSTLNSFTKISQSSISAKSSTVLNNNVFGVLYNQSGGVITHSSLTADGSDENLNPRANEAHSFSASQSGSTQIENSYFSIVDGDYNIYATGTSAVELSSGNTLFSSGSSIRATGSSKVFVRYSNFVEPPSVSVSPGASVMCLFSTQQSTFLGINCN